MNRALPFRDSKEGRFRNSGQALVNQGREPEPGSTILPPLGDLVGGYPTCFSYTRSGAALSVLATHRTQTTIAGLDGPLLVLSCVAVALGHPG